ncbi:MAG TPA: DNA-protecting protein DprA [Microbacterium sp.]|uniref:DNA-processing protein DprA n=1 Tax=Microbacterium sp. TaxID=51671 RepID=UPI000EBCB8C7|nr:DNA-protecting protein DprA [Microbacterium sp.]
MIDDLLADARIRAAIMHLRPEGDPTDSLARVAWNVLAEPGDGVAGALISQLGAGDALRLALTPEALMTSGLDTVDETTARTRQVLREGRKRWIPRADAKAVHDALRSAAEVSAQLVLPGDPEWPLALDDLEAHAPLLLWVRGDALHLATDESVAMVGARAATSYGDHIAADLSGDLATTGTVIVSGGAYGIDGAAHRAALGVGGATIAFLAGGVDRAYPSGHQQLFGRIRDSGAVISEVPCGTAPTKWRFLARNRLIAAMGAATVVVEAGWRSGSLNTAGHAAALGRPLGAVPGPVTSAASAGCHRLMREYDARCVTNAAEVRELFGEAQQVPATDVRTDPDQIRLLDALSTRTARPAQDLAARAGLATEKVAALLGMMALENRVTHTDSGWRRM